MHPPLSRSWLTSPRHKRSTSPIRWKLLTWMSERILPQREHDRKGNDLASLEEWDGVVAAVCPHPRPCAPSRASPCQGEESPIATGEGSWTRTAWGQALLVEGFGQGVDLGLGEGRFVEPVAPEGFEVLAGGTLERLPQLLWRHLGPGVAGS